MTPLQHRPHEVQSSDEADNRAGRGSILVECITRSHSTHRLPAKPHAAWLSFEAGEPSWIRTSDLLIKSQLLYRLSYGPT